MTQYKCTDYSHLQASPCTGKALVTFVSHLL